MEKLMTARQVAELLEVNLSTIYHWVHIGLIPYVKLGKCVRFKKSELFRWIDKNLRKERISFKKAERVLQQYPSSRQKEFLEFK
jgi:excisionase family DNA binding protein